MIEYSEKNHKIVRRSTYGFSKMIINQPYTLYRTLQDTTEWSVLFIKNSTSGKEYSKKYIKKKNYKEARL